MSNSAQRISSALIFRHIFLSAQFFVEILFFHKVRNVILSSLNATLSEIHSDLASRFYSVRFIENEFRPCFQSFLVWIQFLQDSKIWIVILSGIFGGVACNAPEALRRLLRLRKTFRCTKSRRASCRRKASGAMFGKPVGISEHRFGA